MHYVWKILLNGKGFSKISIEKGEYVEVLLLCTYFSCVYMNLCHYVSMNMGVYPMTLLHKTRTVRKHQNSRHNNNYLVAYAQDYHSSYTLSCTNCTMLQVLLLFALVALL